LYSIIEIKSVVSFGKKRNICTYKSIPLLNVDKIEKKLDSLYALDSIPKLFYV